MSREETRPLVVLVCSADDCNARFGARDRFVGRVCKRCGAPLVRKGESLPDAAPVPDLPELVALPEPGKPVSFGEQRFPGYDQLEVLWSDQRGELLRGRDVRSNRTVALRTLPAEVTADPARAASFLERAQHTARLEHPSIVVIHEVGLSTSAELYATRHWIVGERLRPRLERMARRGAPPQISKQLGIFLKICNAMRYAHDKGVTHGALGAESIILGDYGEVVVLDWDKHDTVVTGAQRASMEADLRQLGELLYQMMTLSLPIDERRSGGKRRRRTARGRGGKVAELPRELEVVVRRTGFMPGPDAYEGVADLARDIEAYLDGETLSSVRYSPMERLAKWGARWRGPLAVLGVVALVLVLLVGLRAYREAADLQAARQRADAMFGASGDPSQLAGWGAIAQPGSAPPVRLRPDDERLRSQWFEQTYDACRAYERVLTLAPGDRQAKERRRSLGVRLGRLALLGGDEALARRVFRDLVSYGESEAAAERLIEGVARVRNARLEAEVAAVGDVIAELKRARGRAPATDELLHRLLRHQGQPAIQALSDELDQLTSWRQKHPDAPWDPRRLQLAQLCCRGLGRMDSAGGARSLGSFLAVVELHELVEEAAAALGRSGKPLAKEALIAAAARFRPAWVPQDVFDPRERAVRRWLAHHEAREAAR